MRGTTRISRWCVLLGGALLLSASLQRPETQEIPLRSARLSRSGAAMREPRLVFSPLPGPSAVALSGPDRDAVIGAPGAARRAVVRGMKTGDCPRVSADFIDGHKTLRIDAVGVCGAQGWVYYYGFVAAGESFVAGRDVYLVTSAGVRRDLSALQENEK